MSSSSQPGQRSRGAVTPLQHAALRPAGPGSATHLRLPPTLSHQPLSPPQWQSPLAGGVVLAAGLPGNDGAAAAAYAQAVLLPEQQQRVLLGSLARSSDAGDRGSSPEHWALAGAGPVLRASVTSSEASAHYRAQSVPGTPDMALPFRDAADGASTFAQSRSGSMAGSAAAIQLTPNSSVLKSPFTSTGASPLFAEPLPATKELTFLECVVELLKGTKCLKRKNLLQVNDGRIWLAADMSAVKYRYIPRRGPAVEDEFEVAKVRKIKSTDREISIVVDEKKTVEFILSSREKACVWLSGLCCLVPPRATVKTKYKHVTEHRENYDPLRDSWNGKPLIQRKWFKQYILLGSIGRGAFGKVKLALSRTDRRFYAVKVLSKAMMRKQNRNSAFDRVSHQDSSLSTGFNSDSDAAADVQEVTVMRNLDHPNVVKLVDTHDDVENDRLFIVLEYVALGPVMNSSKLTGATPMDRSTVRPIFIDALAGLMYLHSRGVVHRDFKPENLLLAGDETAKISDFGSARAYDDAAADAAAAVVNPHRAAVGTPAFTAPELCLSEKSPPAPPVPYAADIWSLGVTLFYMWYGQAPFLAKSVFEMYDAICTQTLEFPKSREAPASLRNLLTSMLEKIPSKRATFAVILQSPWLSEGAHGKSLKRIVDLREQAIR
jgi:serine/threonine protein kinase